MRELLGLDAIGVWVTFIEELASFSDQIVSMVSLIAPEDSDLANVQSREAPSRRLRIRARDRAKIRAYIRADQGAHRVMKAFLMYRDRDFDPQQLLSGREKEARFRRSDQKLSLERLLPWNAQALRQDSDST